MKRFGMRIVIIDLQTYWREYAAKILRNAGHQILTLDTYKEALQLSRDGASWDLVLLGCASVTQEERMLVAHLIARQQSVIVLSTALSLQDMRGLFLQGTLDVTDKTYHPAEILTTVERVQDKRINRDRPWTLAGKGAFV